MFVTYVQDRQSGGILIKERSFSWRRAQLAAYARAGEDVIAWIDLDLFGVSFGFIWHS